MEYEKEMGSKLCSDLLGYYYYLFNIIFHRGKRKAEKRKEACEILLSLSWVVVLSCCELFRPIPALAPEVAALQ